MLEESKTPINSNIGILSSSPKNLPKTTINNNHIIQTANPNPASNKFQNSSKINKFDRQINEKKNPYMFSVSSEED